MLSPILQRPAGIPVLASLEVASPVTSPSVDASAISRWVALGRELIEAELAAARDGRVVGAEHHLAVGQLMPAQHALVIEAADRTRADELVASTLALVAGEAQASARLVRWLAADRTGADLAAVSRET